MKSLGSPTHDKLKPLNETNWIDDEPVVEADIEITEDIWGKGKDIATLKGCTARRAAETFVDDTIETLQVLKSRCGNIAIHMGALSISGQSFLTGAGKPLHFQQAVPMTQKTSDGFCEALDENIQECNDTGCQVTKI